MILISLKQKKGADGTKIHFFFFFRRGPGRQGEKQGGGGGGRERRGPEVGGGKRMRPVGRAREMNASSASTKMISSCSRLRRSLSRDFKRKVSKKTKLMLTRRAEFQRAHEKCLTFYSLFFFSFCSSDGPRRKNKDYPWSMFVL